MDYSRMMIITLDEKSVLFSTDAQKLGIHVEKYFERRTFIIKLLNYLDKKLNLQLASFFYGNWKKKLKEIDFILLNSHFFSRPLIKYLNRHYPDIRIVVWYSNPVVRDTPVSFYSGLNCELWSFDEKDCEKYGMHPNNQFIDRTKLIVTKTDDKYHSDVCFIGVDKDRLPLLLELEQYFISKQIKPLIYVVDSSKNSRTDYAYKEALSYSELINYEGNTGAILDIVQSNQQGISLRPLEALFLNKKLITNNPSVQKLDFYRWENMFILTETNQEELAAFLEVPMVPLPESVTRNYQFSGWFANFFKK
ncbi:lipopolysaccharide biosynthesis protein [Enterococcus wangshanyuanii]|uniref:Lipopolysaccharide core biosynthesis protein RfaS n=1 Tax=Enterococcus wangshanyuanii TaxID=2005703 RepID=A0ABQ1PLI1_9ENTE|nr:lipopolysaccharide biosynthesis protein [Enterococcus wangshanyuanii]GGC99231.1 lipopolysaccharide core biosynthesis protein RfaS [Enterococcus wangshanyuanii]